MSDAPLGASHKVAVCLLAWLEHRGWSMFLADNARITVRVGEDDPALSQAEILALLGQLEPQIVALLRNALTQSVH